MTTLTRASDQSRYYQYALWLAIFTILYNLLEGLVSVYFGAQDEALTLFGFGVDSFIEVMSGIGILATAIYNLFTGHRPTATLSGLVISLISIASMWALVTGKRKVGRALNSA